MAVKEKFIVRLTATEREQLEQVVNTGRVAADKRRRAHILLKADQGDHGQGWTDAAIATALDTGLTTIHRVRQAFVEEGLFACLSRRRPTGRQYRKLDGVAEAKLIALACSPAPEGQARWTLRLLADQLVVLEVVEAISPECVRTTLKKTT